MKDKILKLRYKEEDKEYIGTIAFNYQTKSIFIWGDFKPWFNGYITALSAVYLVTLNVNDDLELLRIIHLQTDSLYSTVYESLCRTIDNLKKDEY